MPEQITTKPRAADLLAQAGPEMYRQSYGKGMSLSAWLETQDPSGEYKDGLDAFERLLKCAGIRQRSIPEMGVYASEYQDFADHPQARALVPEWIARTWRRTMSGRPVNTRALYLSQDDLTGGWMQPWADATSIRTGSITPAITLAELVAITTPIDGDAYRAYYLTDVAAEERFTRVGEAAEIPIAKLTGGEHTIRLIKFGRGLEATYEQMRRQRIDKIALHLSRLAAQTESDKVVAALGVLVSGDGNANTAATNYNLTTLDSGTVAGTISLKGWLSAKLKFANPYVCTTVLCTEDLALQLMLLNVGSANIPLVNIQAASGFGGFTHINPGLADNVRLGWTSSAPANKLVLLDNRLGLEHVTEIGANITEVERYVSRQTQALYMTEVEGFAIYDQKATITVTTNA